MKTIIIDDEINCIEMLEWLLQKECPQVEIAGSFQSPIEALKKIPSIKPELIFLDIEMPHLNGFDFLAKIENLDFDVIFTTAYDQFAIKAFRLSAIDYLLKPIDPVSLIEAVNKGLTRRSRLSNDQLSTLFTHITTSGKSANKRIALTASDHLIFVETDSILFCQSSSNYTLFHFVNGDKVTIPKTLRDVAEMLDGAGFFRIHASFLVNISHVKKFTRKDGGYIVMSNEQHIGVSRNKKDEFFDMFSKI